MLSITERLDHPENPLYELVMQVKYLDATNKALAEYLGPPISHHCRLATISFDTIVLYADSPVWYSKLRFLSHDIVRFIQAYRGLRTLTKIRIQIDPLLSENDGSEKRNLYMSSHVAKLLRSIAGATDNPALREAWLRLAHNTSEEHINLSSG